MTKLNITTHTTYELKLVYKDVDGFVIDITGATARMQFRRSTHSPAVIDVTAEITGNEGVIIFTIPPESTSNILKDNKSSEIFLFDALLTVADGKVIMLTSGSAEVKQVITRD